MGGEPVENSQAQLNHLVEETSYEREVETNLHTRGFGTTKLMQREALIPIRYHDDVVEIKMEQQAYECLPRI